MSRSGSSLASPATDRLPGRRQSAYRRFLVGLVTSVVLASLLLVGAVNTLIGRFLVENTARLTEDAVALHVRYILPNIFELPTGAGPAHADEHDPYAGGGYDGDSLNLVVRLHLDIYRVTDATFFRPDGRVSFAYKRDRIGGLATPAELSRLERLSTVPRPEVAAANGRVRVWLPVAGKGGAGPAGFVFLERDLRGEWAQVRRIEASVVGLAVAAALGLFLRLRGVYLTSTREVGAKNDQLSKLALDLEAGNAELLGLTGELETSHDVLLRTLSGVLDTRDNETGGHTARVTRYALRLADELGLSLQARLALERGAMLHDIGKVGVPDSVLLKPGRLDPAELSIMRSHAELGWEMLGGIAFLDEARPVVRHHHERWDGAGYPDRLAGGSIPLLARVFSLCDTYDAITSDRPYAARRTDAEARRVISAESSRQFDPAVVSAFTRIPAGEWVRAGRHPDEAEVPATTAATSQAASQAILSLNLEISK